MPNNNRVENGGNKKLNKLKARAQKLAEEATQMDTNHSCVNCKANFPSKNKLFDHLKRPVTVCTYRKV